MNYYHVGDEVLVNGLHALIIGKKKEKGKTYYQILINFRKIFVLSHEIKKRINNMT